MYQNQTGLDNCSSDANQVRVEGERNCIFDISVLAECGEYPYGYLVNQPETNVAEPCILLKFNKEPDTSQFCFNNKNHFRMKTRISD